MSEPRLGIPARVTLVNPPGRSQGLEFTRVEHRQFGITWDVTSILGSRAHPGRAEDTIGKAILIRW